jgi:ribosome production factor 1
LKEKASNQYGFFVLIVLSINNNNLFQIMGKKKIVSASLKGKKPINGANKTSIDVNKPVTRNPSHIANKMKRSEMFGKYLLAKKAAKRTARLKRLKDVKQLGVDDDDDDTNKAEQIKKQIPKTLDNTREYEPTMVTANEQEVTIDENTDEFAQYFNGTEKPKIILTTRPNPSAELFYFIADLQKLIPNIEYYPRKQYSIKDICYFACNRNYTHIIILSEKQKVCNGMTISHLSSHPDTGLGGPTMFFKVSNVITGKNIPNHGKVTSHIPELNLHGFGTRLGHRVGRYLGSMFPHNDTQLVGRQVVTFHNQRDYIFVRQHRYIFKEQTNTKIIEMRSKDNDFKIAPNIKTGLQELGPRFTLRLRWIQNGTFDTMFGEYEFLHKRKEMDTTRRKFHL